jgi:Fe-S-cluster containining protein
MIAGMADAPSETPAAAPIRLRAPAPQGEATIAGQVVLNIAGETLALDLEVPAASTTLEALLPVFQGLTSEVVRRAAERATATGATISCRAGCGACCRQAVPVAEAEARMIAALVEAMPEPRRTALRARFEAAEHRLAQTTLASRMVDMSDDETVIDVGAKYFGLGLACPFLEAESCSIHPDRPLRCREYLVTSPATACAALAPEGINKVPLAGAPSSALFDVGREATAEGWVLLIQSLSFAERHPAPSARRPAPDWIGAVIGRLAGAANPAA